ncbi:MAG TPA: hypothetical protein VKU00_01750 [Chthonomonadaceae bacterium]|nr:hypothetical protein [Chthonomonadaceae bacterium]
MKPNVLSADTMAGVQSNKNTLRQEEKEEGLTPAELKVLNASLDRIITSLDHAIEEVRLGTQELKRLVESK